MTHNYYELLYAFHIYRHNYRKGISGSGHVTAPAPGPPLALPLQHPGLRLIYLFIPLLSSAGTVMFEYGMRLGREVRTLRGLQKQGNCFLAAINCLRLIRPEYAWIVQPAPGAVVGTAELAEKPLTSSDAMNRALGLLHLLPPSSQPACAAETSVLFVTFASLPLLCSRVEAGQLWGRRLVYIFGNRSPFVENRANLFWGNLNSGIPVKRRIAGTWFGFQICWWEAVTVPRSANVSDSQR